MPRLPSSRITTQALALVAILALAACATATPYQPLAKGLGYSEQRLETNRYRIAYVGNAKTPRESVENYVMYRAAEVTLNNGYDWFVIADRNTNVDVRRSNGGTSGGVGFGFGGGSGGFGSGISIGLNKFLGGGGEAYNAQADILLYKNPKPANDLKGFDAREVKANLEGTIKRPEPKAK